jgi:hypothetical protein
MEPNLSRADRVGRIVAGIALLAVGLLVIRGWLGIVLDLLGALVVFSGTVGFCHVYKFFGVCTLPKREK